MELKNLSVGHYKSYGELATIEIAPLTILVGANNSGKSALAQIIHLLAINFAVQTDNAFDGLRLNFDGINHGHSFVDIVTGRSEHGKLLLSAKFSHEGGDVLFSTEIQNVSMLPYPSECVVQKWILQNGIHRIELNRNSLARGSDYTLFSDGEEIRGYSVKWNGLLPNESSQFPSWYVPYIDELKKWARGVRYLKSPRSVPTSRLVQGEYWSGNNDVSGASAPMNLLVNDALMDAVRQWYRKAFNVSLFVSHSGRYSDIRVKVPIHDATIQLDQSGEGLSQVLQVFVNVLTADDWGAGVDIIEHPESGLHRASHLMVGELLLDNLVGASRPMIIETHAEMILLRARRWIAEGRISPDQVLIYWVDTNTEYGSVLKQIKINTKGELSSWPNGVFTEDYEEVLAIRRAAGNQSATECG